MAFILSIVVLALLFIIIGKINLAAAFSREVKELFAQSGRLTGQVFHPGILADLPAPVQRYFKYVLKEGQPFISYVRIKHTGLFKTGPGKKWVNIKGEQYATTEKPGFIWKGTTAMFVARDMYISDKGRLIASLFSVYKVAEGKGEKYDEGELLRWLGESILYPTNLLPGSRIQWMPIDEMTSMLTFHYNGLSLYFKMTFNETGEITEMETKRHMGDEGLQTWVIKPGQYTAINNVIIPTSFEVIWRLNKGDFSYAMFNITNVEYDIPEKF